MGISAIAMIPARYASSRFPGKLLRKVSGKTILERVYGEISRSSLFQEVVIVSGDPSISKECQRIKANYFEAFNDFICGTDRCLASGYDLSSFDVVVNVQADQPFIKNSIVEQLLQEFEAEESQMIASLMSDSICLDPSHNIVKVLVDKQSYAVDFRRQLPASPRCYQHIGVYGFSRKGREAIAGTNPSQRELKESLEQLRWMDQGIKIKMVPVKDVPVSVDSPNELSSIINNDN